MGDKKSKGKSKSKSNGQVSIKPASREGPLLHIRMRSDRSIQRVKVAAKKAGMSMNTWVCEVLEKSAGAGVGAGKEVQASQQ